MYDFGGSFKDTKRNNNASMASLSTEVSEDECDDDEMPEPGIFFILSLNNILQILYDFELKTM